MAECWCCRKNDQMVTAAKQLCSSWPHTSATSQPPHVFQKGIPSLGAKLWNTRIITAMSSLMTEQLSHPHILALSPRRIVRVKLSIFHVSFLTL
ncbi:hypothetical protein EUGRSUZ_K01084 [Eucalyptus grandis]|uniref:Uncharacterized protein n=2 Tax=Eucalyptus grandis TaxID=71139 RepID=A0ACC3ITW7_EUCGR|nr:hypothetical protein EUGRSUZ_K01084 [Eucalyptus grandis]